MISTHPGSYLRNSLLEKRGNFREFASPAVFPDFMKRPVHPGNPQTITRELLAIAGKPGRIQEFPGEVKTQPGTPGANFRTRTAHPAGEVLEMADRISHVAAISGRRVFHDPAESAVGR